MIIRMQNQSQTINEEICHLHLPEHYHFYWICAYLSLTIVGLFYALLGYRWWRLTMFITSFALGSLFLYIILSSQPMLTEIQLISLSCSIAVLFGSIGALLSYVGLFVNGFCFGLTLSIISYLIWNIKDRANGVQTSFWLIIGLILILGLCCAILSLRFQKFMLIVSSSCLGGVCHFLVCDYFLQLSLLLRYIHQSLRLETPPALCVRHWIVAFILPIVTFVGIAIQYSCTGKNYDHRDSWQKVISAGKKRCRTANLQKIRRHYEQDTLREQIIPHDESHRFRYFYHIRRAHGDALSTDFIQNVRQQQNSTLVHLTSQKPINPSSTTSAAVLTRKDNDSTTTTLTHLM